MIQTKKDLKRIINFERNWYRQYMFNSRSRRIMATLKNEPIKRILKWQIISRKADYYHYQSSLTKHFFSKFLYLYYVTIRNILGEKLGLEIDTRNISKGLVIYHFNNVINDGAIIGENLHLHGCNVIGNAGNGDMRCPFIGNNVMMGAGAKVIGNVTIADNIKIAAGAVVVSSFTEPGITIGGVPARRLK